MLKILRRSSQKFDVPGVIQMPITNTEGRKRENNAIYAWRASDSLLTSRTEGPLDTDQFVPLAAG